MNGWGLEATFISPGLEETKAAIKRNTKIIILETPSNPMMRLSDIAAVAEVSHHLSLIS